MKHWKRRVSLPFSLSGSAAFLQNSTHIQRTLTFYELFFIKKKQKQRKICMWTEGFDFGKKSRICSENHTVRCNGLFQCIVNFFCYDFLRQRWEVPENYLNPTGTEYAMSLSIQWLLEAAEYLDRRERGKFSSNRPPTHCAIAMTLENSCTD